MGGGWIKLHRSILDWRWYGDQNTRVVFIHLLLTANHKDNAWRHITIKQGQRAVSYERLAEELRLTVQNVRTAVKHLKSTGELTTKLTGGCPIITILNYGKYQALRGEGNEAGEGELTDHLTDKLTGNQQATNRQLTPNKKDKNEKNEEEVKNTPLSPTEKFLHGETVRLTALEHQDLVNRVGEAGAARCIEILDGFKTSTGKAYRSDMGAIRNWVLKRYEEEQVGKGRASPAKESEQQRKARAFQEAHEWAKEEDRKNGINQGSDNNPFGTDQYKLPGK